MVPEPDAPDDPDEVATSEDVARAPAPAPGPAAAPKEPPPEQPEPEADEDDRPARLTSGERQRQAAALSELAKSLVAMNASQLGQVALPADVREEVLACRHLGRGARVRQIRRIAQLLRAHDIDQIRAHAEDAGHKQRRRAAKERIYEAWRERLVNEKDVALTQFVDEHPMADPQRLRQLLRQARRDPGSGKSKQALREVLKLVREVFETEATLGQDDEADDEA